MHFDYIKGTMLMCVFGANWLFDVGCNTGDFTGDTFSVIKAK